MHELARKQKKSLNNCFSHVKRTKTNMTDFFAMHVLSYKRSANTSHTIGSLMNNVSSIFADISVNHFRTVLFAEETELIDWAVNSPNIR